MNQLDKLIEQYERENPGCFALEGEIQGNCDFYKGFVLWLASRPTCGVEQRRFLDEIENCYRGDLATESIALGKYSCIIDNDIVADLHKVTKGE